MAVPTESVTEVTALQIPSQPEERHRKLIVLATGPILLKTDHLPSPVGPASSQGCGRNSGGAHGCWGLEVKVAIVLVALAGLLILALFYRILILRHRLRVAEARNALEYSGFYHMAQYSLKELDLPPVTPPVVTALITQQPPTPSEAPSPPPPDIASPSPPLPPAEIVPPVLPLPPPPPPLPPMPPPSHPIIFTTPPSPHSDVEIYSRIGALRPSRLSNLSQTQVVLFEHSSL
ncbi:uncharacterized protein LOC111193852 [Astyanax mexicanus]|uniref:Uncharacterized protein n=1 Tax=Astyanax mexicanus TaxID=7994 RepID=A0A8T2L3Y4_ASTMX|nr:uncharacterized protein LOC111193852 [Astyanax mexicanus]XP_022531659.1 uncharacterized protein LOC111193852 [Astyanax mexicanus]KAG9265547.1 hypothetical protein AMEX_G19999 [Astyanax mexicanus]